MPPVHFASAYSATRCFWTSELLAFKFLKLSSGENQASVRLVQFAEPIQAAPFLQLDFDKFAEFLSIHRCGSLHQNFASDSSIARQFLLRKLLVHIRGSAGATSRLSILMGFLEPCSRIS